MRISPLLLSAALLASMPVMAATNADAPKAPAPTPAAAPAVSPAATTAPAASVFSDAQRSEIENVVKEYLTQKNPEVIMQAMQELKKRQEADSDAKSKSAITSNKDKLYNDPNSPVGGNPKGDVTVVEFFDYQCGYCKMSQPTVEKLIKEDKNVKVVYKEFPILGPASTTATKAALASVKQNKYEKLHEALMTEKGHFTDDIVYKIAKDAGLDVEKLKKDMNDPSIDKMIEANIALGTEIGARGTPTFIINDELFPGAMEYPQLKKAVEDARTAGKKP
ncbi:MAG: DsbA family protein [Bdellovibrionales bacterium]